MKSLQYLFQVACLVFFFFPVISLYITNSSIYIDFFTDSLHLFMNLSPNTILFLVGKKFRASEVV